jgi:exonuclease VII small subunit
MNLIKFCSDKLEEVERKVSKLVKESDGKYGHQPFEADENEEA